MTRGDEDGFTFIELLVAVSILSVIMGAITSGLIAVIRTTGGTSERISQSHDSQLLSTWLVPDLQSAANPNGIVRVSPATAPSTGCAAGTGTPFSELQLSWTDAATNTPYSYYYVVDTTTWVLRRNFVTGPSPEASFIVVHNLEDPAKPPPAGATAWYPACFLTDGTGKVTVTITTLLVNGSSQFAFQVAAQTRQPYLPPAPLPTAPPASADTNGDGRMDGITVHFAQPVACVPGCGLTNWTVSGEPGWSVDKSPNLLAINTSSDSKTVTLTMPAALTIDTKAAGMTIALAAGSLVGAGGTPVAFVATPVKDGMAPVVVSATSQDLDLPLGTLDHVVVTYSEPVTNATDVSTYKLLAAPGGIDVDPMSVSALGTANTDYSLDFPSITTVDTVAAAAKLRVSPGPPTDGERTNPAADVPVADGMAPVLDPAVPPVAKDLNTNGKADQVVVAFTEPLATPYSAPTSVWTLVNAPSAATVASVSVSGNLATLILAEGATFNTATTGFTVALAANANGVRDARGNRSGTTPTPVSDRMKPILVSLTTTPGTTAGKAELNDTMTVSFSEPVMLASTSPTMTITKANGNNIFTIPDLVTVNMNTGSYASSSVTCLVSLAPSGAVVTVTVQSCIGNTSGTAANGTATPATTIRDAATPTNAAVGTLTPPLPSTTVLF